jgi:hypothetical protein
MNGGDVAILRRTISAVLLYLGAAMLAVSIASVAVAMFRPTTYGGLTLVDAWLEVWRDIGLQDLVAAWPVWVAIAATELVVFRVFTANRPLWFLALVAAGQAALSLLMLFQLR